MLASNECCRVILQQSRGLECWLCGWTSKPEKSPRLSMVSLADKPLVETLRKLGSCRVWGRVLHMEPTVISGGMGQDCASWIWESEREAGWQGGTQKTQNNLALFLCVSNEHKRTRIFTETRKETSRVGHYLLLRKLKKQNPNNCALNYWLCIHF